MDIWESMSRERKISVLFPTVLNQFRMSETKDASTPMGPSYTKLAGEDDLLPNNKSNRQAVGTLLHKATTTHLVIVAMVPSLCRHVSKPHQRHWKTVKQVLQYPKTG